MIFNTSSTKVFGYCIRKAEIVPMNSTTIAIRINVCTVNSNELIH